LARDLAPGPAWREMGRRQAGEQTRDLRRRKASNPGNWPRKILLLALDGWDVDRGEERRQREEDDPTARRQGEAEGDRHRAEIERVARVRVGPETVSSEFFADVP